MIKIYIDESGDLGRNEGYFIIAMVVLYNQQERIKNIVKSFCAKNGLEEIHSYNLSFPQKQYLINKLSKQQDYCIEYIIADKMMIKNEKLFADNNLLFNYLLSFLLKTVVRANTDDISILLDNRTQKVASYNSLKDYIKIKSFGDWKFTRDLNIDYINSKECKTVQIADLVASCIRRNYVYKQPDLYSKLNITRSIQFPYATFRDSFI